MSNLMKFLNVSGWLVPLIRHTKGLVSLQRRTLTKTHHATPGTRSWRTSRSQGGPGPAITPIVTHESIALGDLGENLVFNQ